MNEQQCASLLAADFDSLAGITFHAAGSSATGEKPYGVVRFQDFTEDVTLLGNYDGTISIMLRTIPEDTSQEAVDAWADEITSRLASKDSVSIALSGFYSAAECWGVQTQTSSVNDGVRETPIEVSTSLVQLA